MPWLPHPLQCVTIAYTHPVSNRRTKILWTVRRESWLPPFPPERRYDRDRDPRGRFEE
jgi:hypothetical protein